MDFWKKFEKDTKDLEKRNTEQTAKIVQEAKERNKRLEEEWERKNMYTVRATKCFLVQVMDSDGNEVKCEYVFTNTKKEAEDIGYKLRDDIVKESME